MKRTTAKRKPATRRKAPAKKNNLRPLIIGAAVIGGGYLAYEYLLKPMLNKTDEQDQNDQGTPPPAATVPPPPPAPNLTTVIQTVTNLPVGTVKIDETKEIKPGAATSPELKASKIAFNDVMEKAEKAVKIYNPVMKISKERLQTIANLRKDLAGGVLDPNTEYGSYSQKVASVILGKTTFNLKDVRNQRAAFYLSLGLSNPY